MAALACDIVTPTKKLFSAENVSMVIVPGVEGEMGFLYGHVPLVSALADGTARLQFEKEEKEKKFSIKGGYVQVTGKKVIVLADSAEEITEE
ncbi:MAG: ATP synthase F1 subunit epsilon [Eggerthellaceae bacterium]|nr:ATP synthase F1 subunit epsilon [Eggerthellaceae bacterium]